MRLQFIDGTPNGLSTAEEQRLAGIIDHGLDEEKVQAVQQLVTSNLRLAVYIACKFLKAHPQRSNHDEEDVVGEAFLAMTNAAWSFKPGRNKFGTYAGTAIHHALADAIRPPFAVPKYMREACGHYEKIRDEMGLTSFEEMQQAGGVEKVYEILTQTQHVHRKKFDAALRRALHLCSARTVPIEKPKD